MIIDTPAIMNYRDGFYTEPKMTVAIDEYCPECDCQIVYQLAIDGQNFWCPKCNCQWELTE